MMDCFAIQSEIQANNQHLQQLASEHGWKVAQNVAAGVAGLVVWPLWFGMDFQGAAGKEAAAIQQRQQYLVQLAAHSAAKTLGPTKTSAGPTARKRRLRPASF